MRGQGEKGVEKKDPHNHFEYLERVYVQSSTGPENGMSDGAFAEVFCQMPSTYLKLRRVD